MQKINYIIIFTLVLALGMIFKQLTDYKTITEQLLQTNTESQQEIKNFENKVLTLVDENGNLQNKIISIEEELSLLKLKHENQDFSTDHNQTKNFPLEIQPIKNEQQIPTLNVTPNITIDEENEITGFGLEYTQKF